MVTNGWPSERKEAPEELRVYWNFRDELSVYDDVLYKSYQVIVPASLRPEMLRKIHKAHQGADSSIRRARESLFWSGMQAAIRETCLSCGICSQLLSERPQEPMKFHEIPNRPCSKVSADIFQLAESNYLVMVDHYSYFFEQDSLRNTTATIKLAEDLPKSIRDVRKKILVPALKKACQDEGNKASIVGDRLIVNEKDTLQIRSQKEGKLRRTREKKIAHKRSHKL